MWNYRIIKDSPESYGLYEVIYNDDGEISAHSEDPEVIGESPEDLLTSLRLMLDDAQKSYYNILDMGNIEFHGFCDDLDKAEAITLEEFDKIIEDLN